MLPALLLASLPVGALALAPTHGVAPDQLAKYTPEADGTWRCLTTATRIPWSAVNDDYCDCDDGSDEPGTGACKDTTFYCHNVGHIGTSIPASRVNDGICEPACCDGSDEKPGVCPNRCKEIGEAHRAKVDAERKLRKTGSKIRATYIAFAQKEKKRLEGEVEKANGEIETREKEVARLRDIAERTEAISAAAMDHKKNSPLYAALTEQAAALKALQKAHAAKTARVEALGQILDSLRTGYNPNYQDMAVLEAVRGWEQLAGLPHINDVRKAEANGEELPVVKQQEKEAALDEDEFTDDQLEMKVNELGRLDFESLLVDYEKHVGEDLGEPLLFDIESYLPEAVVPYYDSLKETFVGWLRTAGIVKDAEDDNSEASTKARTALNEAERSLQSARDDKRNAENDLRGLFDVEKFGADGAWKKLDGLCLEKDMGEYTYEVCLFDEARQKPNKGGSTFSLGRWSGWNPNGHIGSEEYYSTQDYTNGAKCWNGPSRSVHLSLSCGTENALLSVTEPEKCEYHITGTTPALCMPLDDNVKREEL